MLNGPGTSLRKATGPALPAGISLVYSPAKGMDVDARVEDFPSAVRDHDKETQTPGHRQARRVSEAQPANTGLPRCDGRAFRSCQAGPSVQPGEECALAVEDAVVGGFGYCAQRIVLVVEVAIQLAARRAGAGAGANLTQAGSEGTLLGTTSADAATIRAAVLGVTGCAAMLPRIP